MVHLPNITVFNKPITPSVSVIIWFICFCYSIILPVLKESILPDYFFYDADTIFSYYGGVATRGSSYSMTAWFFESLGVARESVLFSIISGLLLFSVSILAIIKTGTRTVPAIVLVLYLFFLSLGLIYLTVLSKDFIVFCLVSIWILLIGTRYAYCSFFFMLALIYAYFFRMYWFIFVAVFLGFIFFCKFWPIRYRLVFYSLLSISFLSFFYFYIFGENIDSFRVVYNEGRLERGVEASRSVILPWLGVDGAVLSALNSYLTWLSFFVPVPLFLMFKPYYLFIFFMLVSASMLLGKANLQRFEKGMNWESISFGMIFSFTLVQAVFEPDYGSFVRHISPFMPVFIFVVLSRKRGDEY